MYERAPARDLSQRKRSSYKNRYERAPARDLSRRRRRSYKNRYERAPARELSRRRRRSYKNRTSGPQPAIAMLKSAPYGVHTLQC